MKILQFQMKILPPETNVNFGATRLGRCARITRKTKRPMVTASLSLQVWRLMPRGRCVNQTRLLPYIHAGD